jgi:hypothetical protein
MRSLTTLCLEILTADRDAVIARFGLPDDDRTGSAGPATRCLTYARLPSGRTNDLYDLARAGAAFVAEHDGGTDSLGTALAACHGRCTETPFPGGDFMVRIDPLTCQPDPTDLSFLRRWRQTEARVRAIFAAAAQPAPCPCQGARREPCPRPPRRHRPRRHPRRRHPSRHQPPTAPAAS